MVIKSVLVGICAVYFSYLVTRNPLDKLKIIVITLIIVGLLIVPSGTPIMSQDSTTLENPETVDGIENFRGYSQSETVSISGNSKIVIDPEVKKIIVKSKDGEKLDEFDRGRNEVNEERISEYDKVVFQTVGKNNNTIDSETVTVKSG